MYQPLVAEFLATTTTMIYAAWYMKSVTPPTPIRGVFITTTSHSGKSCRFCQRYYCQAIRAPEYRKSVSNSAALIFTMSAWLNGNSINHSVQPSVQHISVLKSQGEKKKEMRNYGITGIFGFGITVHGLVQMVRWNREVRVVNERTQK